MDTFQQKSKNIGLKLLKQYKLKDASRNKL